MEMIDLSIRLEENMPVYPGDKPVTLSREKTIQKDGYTAYLLQTGLHAGTHVDMPMHLLKDERTADGFPPGMFAGNGVLLDVRGQSVLNYKSEYEKRVKPGDIVLLYTGWNIRQESTLSYFSGHPVVEDGLAEFFCKQGIRMLGMDMPSPDEFPFPVHKRLLSANIFILENLINLSAVPTDQTFTVFALPLKIAAEASPVRAVAVL